ncbi:membrane cofactor protein-like isoform X1 [Corythoichthys intestinalis]|uniref:membrane cofactor protein-like isoform X1 n=1 Tax=Corythoichthys intestinalis TaxID=161448 RepID=UPI0025A5947F|nr:membrane cofactor protein-like isoform X1 [Corythoichthys intestinalis]
MDVSSLFLLLFYLDVTMVAQAQDCSRPTVGNNMHVEELLKDTFEDGSTATLKCDVGYSQAGGSQAITCTAGTWTQVTLQCERVNCGPADNVANGNLDYSEGTLFGDKVSITCKSGYILVGATQRLCLSSTKWSEHPPTCQVVTCDPPVGLDKGFFGPIKDIYDYGNVIKYTCPKGYVLNGPSTAECSGDKTFNPKPPKCIQVKCKDLDIPNAEIVSGGGPPYGYKASVTFRCLPGYEMVGSRSPTCDITSRWSPDPPTCQRKGTTTSTTPTTKRPDGKDTPTGNGSNNLGMSVGIAVAVVIGVVIIICAGCYYFGGLAFITKKNKKRYRRGAANNKSTTDEERVVLS